MEFGGSAAQHDSASTKLFLQTERQRSMFKNPCQQTLG